MARGRPARIAPGGAVTPLRVRVPVTLFDELCREAAAAGESLSDTVRRRLARFSSYKNRHAPDRRGYLQT
jgi:hypothetical protein